MVFIKKIFSVMLLAVTCLVSLMFFNTASAKLRLVSIDSNGYKTYFDTNSIDFDEDEDILSARIVGKRPDGSTIMDTLEKFKIKSDDIYFSIAGNGWKSITTSEYATENFKAIYEYIKEVSEEEEEDITPPQDTWVLWWNGANYYVKAGSLNQSNAGYDAAPEFTCRVDQNGIVRNYKFHAKGYAVLYVNGKLHGNSREDPFVDAI